ncbi:MAG: hypothetical protein ACRC51_05810 [Cetobacterium sp.]
MEKIIKSMKTVEVNVIEITIVDRKCPMPVRTIQQYQTFDGQLIGIVDPLDKYYMIDAEYLCKK